MTVFAPLTEFDFHPRLAATPGVSLVLFSSPACGACRRMEAVLPKGAAGVSLFKVDVQRSTALARQFDVFHLPALFLFVAGRYHAEIRCEALPEAIRDTIKAALAMPPEEEP
jgi:thioredoxin-like negative regulator of GroEL